MPYATLAEMRALLETPSGDTDDDALITACLTRSQALIDAYMRTIRSSFVSFEPVTQTRYYDSEDGYGYVEIHDLVSVTSLASDTALTGTYSTTIVAGDYWLHPHAAPYRALELTRRGTTTAFVAGTRTIRIIGSWGFPAVPADVTQATIEEAIRMFGGKAASFSDVIGVAGEGDFVLSRALSARTKFILNNYSRPIFA